MSNAQNFSNKRFAIDLQAAMVRALETFGREHGVKITANGGMLESSAIFTAKLRIELTGDEGEKSAMIDFARHCGSFGLTSAHYKAQFKARDGSTYELIGFELRRVKYPLRGRNVHTGKELLFQEGIVKQITGAKVPA